jgi:hypothetical protein
VKKLSQTRSQLRRLIAVDKLGFEASNEARSGIVRDSVAFATLAGFSVLEHDALIERDAERPATGSVDGGGRSCEYDEFIDFCLQFELQLGGLLRYRRAVGDVDEVANAFNDLTQHIGVRSGSGAFGKSRDYERDFERAVEAFTQKQLFSLALITNLEKRVDIYHSRNLIETFEPGLDSLRKQSLAYEPDTIAFQQCFAGRLGRGSCGPGFH